MVAAASAVLLGAAAGTGPERIEYLAAVTVRGTRFSYRGTFHRELGFSHGFSLGWGGAASTVSQTSGMIHAQRFHASSFRY